MKEFLKKYLTEEQFKEVEDKYLADHPEAKGLPIHISKTRLDEVLGQKRAAEELVATTQAELETLKGSIENQVKEAVDKANVESAKHEKDALDAANRGYAINEAIYKAHGKNVTAIKALIDPDKKLDDEIARLQKTDGYLFDDDIPNGTGKNGQDTNAVDDKELAQMRAAIGI